jgi:hypothetical protein
MSPIGATGIKTSDATTVAHAYKITWRPTAAFERTTLSIGTDAAA